MVEHSGESVAQAEWRFVANVRDARRLLTEADDLLWGIFGYAEDHPDRAQRMRLAKAAVAAAASLFGREADR